MSILTPRSVAAAALPVALSLCLCTLKAHADVSSWLFVGAGPSGLVRPHRSVDLATSMQVESGLGSSPVEPVAVGGLLRMHTRFGEGSDFGLFVRTATGGYVRGSWGAAVDLGGYERWWGQAAPGYAGTLSIGAPWGITLALDAARDTKDTSTLAAVIGLDFARFSVYRSTGQSWFPNPFPSPRAER